MTDQRRRRRRKRDSTKEVVQKGVDERKWEGKERERD